MEKANNICQKFRKILEDFSETEGFVFVTTFLIVANTVVLALDKYP
jgi:hypothetical protein